MQKNSASKFDRDFRRTFGTRRVVPRAHVFEIKEHLRIFLSDALEELGFVTRGSACPDQLVSDIGVNFPDVIVFGLSAGGAQSARAMELIAALGFGGKVLLLGPAASPISAGVSELGHRLGLSMLPVLKTPFADRDLRTALRDLVPALRPPSPPVDVKEALDAGWLELWYQPKLAARDLAFGGAEALIRMRHPNWGVVPPACFLPSATDPSFRQLSAFVINRAVNDWRYLVTQRGPIQLAINLPLVFFSDQSASYGLRRMLPNHPAFEGLIVEIDATDLAENLAAANELARALRFHNIGLSIDDLGEQWPAFVQLEDCAFAELKLDRGFIHGCANDAERRWACRQIIGFARSVGAKVIAEGVEDQRDYMALRSLGVDQIQGFSLAKPMTAQKLARFKLGAFR